MQVEMGDLTSHTVHELLTRALAPLPVPLISTVGEDGVYNAAPFSLAVPVSYKPPIVIVSFGLRRGQRKDTVKNIEYTRDFVINIMDDSLIQSVIQTSIDFPADVDEIKEVGLTAVASDKIKSPWIAEAQVSLECQLMQTVQLGEELRFIIFGEVLTAHVKDELWIDGNVDPYKLKSVGRLAGGIYCRTEDIFQMKPQT
ncbi:flavin reductase family protein [Bacteroidota bacterium]